MFRVEHNVPDVYIHKSRDFQLLARLYDLVFQSSRFSIDSMEFISDTHRCNSEILPLIATKVGFFSDIDLPDEAYRKVLSAFPYIINYKGSLKGIQFALNLFERITNTSMSMSHSNDSSNIVIILEEGSIDVNVLDALLQWIKPTGCFIDYVVRKELDFEAEYNVSSDKLNINVMWPKETEGTEGNQLSFIQSSSYTDSPATNVGFTIVPVDTEETPNEQ